MKDRIIREAERILPELIDDIKDKLKEQVREIMTDAKGEFVKDKFNIKS